MTNTSATPDWAAARGQMMLDPSVINLNTGSFGPTPRPVFERATKLREHLASEPMDFLVRAMPPLLWRARDRLANFLGTTPQRLVFTTNVSTAMNIVAAGLSLEPGEILMSDREYGAMQWVWERAALRQGLTIRTYPLPLMPRDDGEILDAIFAAISPQTRLLFFSHVYSATGMVMPAAEICSLARRRGILTVIDGAHAPAMIRLEIDKLGCDFYGGNCHKWLLAPIGAGFLILGAEAADRLEPLQVSWGYKPDRTKLDEPDEYGSTPRTRYLEFAGTCDPCAWLAVPEAIDFQTALGWDAVRARMHELSAESRARFADRCGMKLTTPTDPARHGALTAYWWPAGHKAERLRQQIWERRIEVLIGEWPEGPTLRVSNHFYTTTDELDRLADCVRAILAGA